MVEHSYPTNTLIAIEELSDRRLTLEEALDLTVNRVMKLADMYGLKSQFNEVMDGGNLFYEIQSEIPESKINSI